MAHPQPHHHPHGGESLRDAARSSLESAGEQWTDMRAAIFDAVSDHARPASAYDIADIVSSARGKRVAPNTVYRILDLFVANNLVRRVESTNAFIANEHPGCLHDCIFLICDSCGQTTHIDDDAVAGGVRDAARRRGFAPARPVIEVHGRCDDCD
ncbi:MAG: transcriptional repressor [Sphingomonadales bacterium]|nr:transcriptional repressor [Sphingomonadales bacterium]